MVEIKTTISSSTYSSIFETINSSIFEDDIYHPERDFPNRRAILLYAFAPDYKIGEDNSFGYLYTDEAEEIFAYLEKNSKQYIEVKASMDKWIDHRLRMVENGSMSLTDYALAKLINTFNEKIEKLDITDNGVKAVEEAVNNINKEKFESNLVDVFLKKGLLDNKASSKPNRATRRANGQTSKNKTTKNKPPIELKTDKE